MSDDWAGLRGGWSTDDAIRLYGAHRLALVRLAVLLLDDLTSAEDVVQDAFARFLSRSRTLQDPDAALAYLRASVVSQSRSLLRRRQTKHEYVTSPKVDPVGASSRTSLSELDREVLAAARQLPARQREVLVLRYWSELTEAQTAEALGVTRGTVTSTAQHGLAAIQGTTVAAHCPDGPDGRDGPDGTASTASTDLEDRLRTAFRAGAEQVEGDDLSAMELPDPAPRSRKPLLLGVAAAACAAVLAAPFVTGDADDDKPDTVRLPEGAVRLDFNGDGGKDVVSVNFDAAARTYLLTVEVFAGPVLTYQGLALNRPTLIGEVDLDGDYSAEIALDVGDDTATLPEFFRYVNGNIRRLTLPPTTERINGWDMTSEVNQFALHKGRLYTWQDDPRSVEEPQRTGFWQWRIKGEEQLEPGPRQERCITAEAELPVDCVFIPQLQTGRWPTLPGTGLLTRFDSNTSTRRIGEADQGSR
ncbi:hypothetical protein BH18ACT9_BH18ACT9_07730 [soil metagenome]